MLKKDDLIWENEVLKRKLQVAEFWMQRQIHESVRHIEYEKNTKDARKKFENLLESDLIETLSQRIENYFAWRLLEAPLYTAERLMDSEIYWITLQKHPTIDAFPVIASYQKILDAFFEESITMPFRMQYREGWLHNQEKWLESDIANIVNRGYTLSLGRWYQFLLSVRSENISWDMSELLVHYLQLHESELLSLLLSDAFFLRFETLIEMGIFGSKRHDKKVSYTDAKKTREILVGNYEKQSLLQVLFAFFPR